MNDKIKHILAKAYKTDSVAKNKWRIENREQLREQRKKELKELIEKDKTMSNNKQSMKLYTEEQVRQALMKHQNAAMLLSSEQIDYLIEEITPIELPSDEEIEKMRKEYIDNVNTMVHRDLERDGYLDIGFLAGAKHIIDKIQGGNK